MLKWLKKVLTSSKQTHEELNIVNSIANAKRLYKELIIKSHPDKHPNNVELAQSLTERVNNSRYNYNELLELKDIIEKELS